MKRRDPGAAWTNELLAPLRRQMAEVDVTQAVMRRISAYHAAADPARLAPRPMLAIGSLLALAIGALGLAAFLLSMGTPGAGTTRVLTDSGLRFLFLLRDSLSSVVLGISTALVHLLRGVWVVLTAGAPLVRGASGLAAAGGTLSILLSVLLFDHARRRAPAAGSRPDDRHPGGNR